MFRAHPDARLLTVHVASGSFLPVYRNMFDRALSNAAQINRTESDMKAQQVCQVFYRTPSLTKPMTFDNQTTGLKEKNK